MAPATRIRAGLLAGAAVTTALMALGLVRYRIPIADPVVVGFLVAFGLGLVAAVGAAVAAGRVRTPTAQGAMVDGCRWGLLLGALWMAEMAVGNLAYPLGAWTAVPYFALIASVVTANVLAGALAARRYRGIVPGALVGAWSGLVSGLIGLATMQTLILAAMPVLRRDPQNVAEFRGAGDFSAAIAGDYLAGGINHLVLVGLLAGTALATLGAALGVAARQRKSLPGGGTAA